MRRVAVIRCGGAGKTTVARALALHTGLPLVQADPIVYADGHTARPESEWQPELNAHAPSATSRSRGRSDGGSSLIDSAVNDDWLDS